ncbi:amino acid adenylation domain-containing protein [Pedobacter sp. WC2423]|uniref:hybrid non-ribosomal peptide synthetase/type I polyketide synthase n=1 Tax=Pedobacter sp. WC2423 TaxID=3234142 RepID=UPI003467D393
MNNQNGVAIAIIGMAGKFPGAKDISEFWDNLSNSIESITSFSDQELTESGIQSDILRDPNYVKANAFVKDKEFFDAGFFGYSAAEASLMDPQIRIFHEICWKALEDAGIDVENNTDKIGLFAGGATNLNWLNYAYLSNKEQLVNEFSASQLRDITFLCSRVSYALNLQGPSIYLNTACSTSLVAIQRAAMSLLLRECKVALAGGVTIQNYSTRGYFHEDGMIQSKDGHCRAFDASASGTVIGEGAGVVVLKRLSDAIADGDHIHAVILGSGINNDGANKITFTAPGIDGQFQAILKAINMAKVPVESIGMLEAHGTGTSLGDPIEVEALNLAFGKSKAHYCALGSVKTNIGHLDVAAGVAGLIKAVLSIQHRQIPASLHYEAANPEINFKESPFYVNTALKEWRNDKYPLRAGVSSFGIGGTNAHIILEEAPAVKRSGDGRLGQVLVFSAKSEAALNRNLESFSSYVQSGKVAELADIAYTLAKGRTAFEFRKSLVCSNAVELQKALSEAITHKAAVVEGSAAPEVIFMFSGQGSQYLQMYGDLYVQELAFKATVDECLKIVLVQSGLDLKPVLFGTSKELINQTRYTQPLLFIAEYALSRLLMSWGIRPDKMIGHSVGEYVAACLSGVFSLEDSLLLVSKRGELMQGAPVGDMLSIGIAEEELKDYLFLAPQVCLAAHNSSSQCVVSGSREQIAEFKKIIELAGYSSRILHTSHAFHSHLMDGILDEFKAVLDKVKINKPELPFISNVTGEFVRAEEIGKAAYWVSHLREPVRFSEGAGRLLSDTVSAVLIEVGPGKALSTFIRSHHLRNSGHHVVSLVRGAQEEGDDLKQLLTGFGKLWSHGVKIDWNGFYSGQVRKKVSLPTYSFEPVRYPVNVDAIELLSELHPVALKERRKTIPEWFYYPSWKLLPMPVLSVDTKGSVLLFIDDDRVFEGLSSRYLESGRKVIRVRTGLAYAEESALSYRLAPGQAGDYQRLFASLSGYGVSAEQLVHGWGLTTEKENIYTDASGERYFYSLLEAVKYWLDSGDVSRDLVVLTSDLHPVLEQGETSGVQSMSLGLLKVLAQEYTGLSGRHIDISSAEISGGLVLDNLYKELQSGDRGSVVSLRQGHRWGEIFDSLSSDGALDSPAFKAGGTYLITGGSGQLGSVLNGYLQKNYQANVILLGRSASLRENHPGHLSAQVFYISCDISDEIAVEAAVKMAEERFGKVDGVIHAAGVVSGSSINMANELTALDFQAQFNPKVRGVEVLDAVFSSRELDFCILISSLSTVLGGLGFGAYGPANIYMDYYLKSQRKLGRLRQWMSVDLDGLSFSGIADDYISGEELTGVLEHSLHFLTHPRLVVSVKALDERYKRWVSSAPDSLLQVIAEEQVGQDRILSQESMLDLWQHILGKPGMDIDDDFFEMGGDSLKVLTLVGRIHKQFNVEISVKEFFNWTTVKKLDEYLSTKLELRKSGTGYVSIPKAAEADYYPLSYAQRRLYFLNQFDKDALAYNIPEFLILTGKINVELFNRAFKLLVRRHESLRTYFEIIDDQPVQRVLEKADPEIVYFQGGDPDQLIADFIAPFELSRAPLIRLGLIALDTEEHILMVDMHHIISDGESKNILIRDFMALYNEEVLPELNLQYKDYAVWQQSELQQQQIHLHKDFWLKEYENEVLTLELPADFPRPLVKQYAGDHLSFELNELETSGLKKLAEKEGVTLFMLLFAVHSILLSKLGNQEDIIIGVPAAGREHAELENILGMFVNTLPIRTNPQGNLTFKEFLAEVKQKTLSCFEHQSYPFEELIDELSIQRDTARNPLFDVVFSYQNYQQTALSISGLELKIKEIGQVMSKFDLTLDVSEKDDKLHFTFEYATGVFKRKTIERFSFYFNKILSSVLEDGNIGLSEIEMISSAEQNQLLNEFNNLTTDYPREKTVVDLFEEQVMRTPEHIAIVMDQVQLTYKELNDKSDQLASLLHDKGVKADSIVSILIDRSIETVIGMLGVLKAGGAYLPIDIDYPKERIDYLLKDSGSELVLMSRRFVYALREDLDYLYIEDLEFVEKRSLPARKVSPGDLCYIIYTSGTTGNPKGVMVEHKNLVRLFFNDKFQFNFGTGDVWTMFHSHCFDFSVWEMYGALLFGGKLVVISKNIARDTKAFLSLLRREKVTVLNQTPSAFYSLIKEENEIGDKALCLNYVIFGGEALSPGNLKDWRTKYPLVSLINMFGITETTVHVTYKEIGIVEILSNLSNIGKPIPTLSAYVLDKYQKLVPQGVIGELYVGGAGVSRGYLGKEDLTNAKFIDDPYEAGAKLYRSGDLVKWGDNGDLVYIGRIDDQIKIRGFRIELGEIESHLLNYDGINEVTVLMKQDKEDKFLVAYYTSAVAIDSSVLRMFLLEKMPDYMVPSYYVHMHNFPLTSNGKLDRKSLPDYKRQTTEQLQMPVGIIEEKLAEIWSEILAVDKSVIGTNISFFELGGQSLKAAALANRIFKEFNVEMPIRDIFKNSAIVHLHDFLKKAQPSLFKSISKAQPADYYPLSYAQKRMYFLYEFDKSSVTYNMPSAIRLSGTLDKMLLTEVFNSLLEYHEVLRTYFETFDRITVQKVLDETQLEIVEMECDFESLPAVLNSFIRPFDLSKAPLVRVGLISLALEEHVLIVDVHHIISDGISGNILIKDFMTLYSAAVLPVQNLQYKDYAVWQQSAAQQEETLLHQDFWLREYQEEVPALELPGDFSRPLDKQHAGAELIWELDLLESSALGKLAEKEGVTMFMLMFAAFNVLLSKLGNQEDIVVGVPTAGRDHAELEGILGMFVNTLPIRTSPEGNLSFREFLSVVKQKTLLCFEHQSYPYEEMIEKLHIKRDTSRNPLFDVMFSYQNYEQTALSVPGLDISPVKFSQVMSKFDLTLDITEHTHGLRLRFEYAKGIFKAETITRFAAYFKKILTSVLSEVNISLSRLEIIPDEERNLLLNTFNNTRADYSRKKTVIDFFEEQVARNPNQVAIAMSNESLTYRELNNNANAIAFLLKQELGNEDYPRVALLFDPSIEVIVCMLGVLKAGGTYVPLAANTPVTRTQSILNDCRADLLLIQESLVHEKQDSSIFNQTKIIPIAKIAVLAGTSENPLRTLGFDELIYILYTSGTTGKPKGVEVKHSGITNMLVAHKAFFDTEVGTRSSQVANISFDASAFEIWPCLASGGRLYIAEQEIRQDPELMYSWLEKNKIEISYQPSVIAEFLLKHILNVRSCDLKILNVAGDKFHYYPDWELPFKLYNLYGPTEDSIWTTCYELKYDIQPFGYNIGKPVANKRIYIVDRYDQLQPLGIYGQLCIAGDGLAKGYLNNEELTRDKFVGDPFYAGEIMYKTGDLARWLPDGNLEFIGRIDNQVKIRGNRVELSEIESQLLKHKSILKTSVLLMKKDNDEFLVAYYTSAQSLDPKDLKVLLSAELPGYMIPGFFIQLDDIALSASGKVDKKALPLPEINFNNDYLRPENDTQERLVRIWAEVLNADPSKISVNANFFDIGGHSVSMIMLNKMINTEFDTHISVAKSFRMPSIISIEAYLHNGDSEFRTINSNIDDAIEEANNTLNFLENTTD